MKYANELIENIISEFNNGKNKCELEKEYNIPRSTIRYWIDNKDKDKKILRKTSDKSIEEIINIIKEKKELYNYILGLYLGDGCISENKILMLHLIDRHWTLVG